MMTNNQSMGVPEVKEGIMIKTSVAIVIYLKELNKKKGEKYIL